MQTTVQKRLSDTALLENNVLYLWVAKESAADVYPKLELLKNVEHECNMNMKQTRMHPKF